MTVTLESELTSADLDRFSAWWLRRARARGSNDRGWMFWWSAAGLALLVGLLLVAGGVVTKERSAPVILLLFAAYVAGGYHIRASVLRDRRKRNNDRLRRRYRTDFGEDGIRFRSTRGDAHWPWSSVSAVDHWDGTLLIELGPDEAFPVGVRELATPQRDSLIAFIKARMGGSAPD